MSTRSFVLSAALTFTRYSIFKPAAFHELMYQKFQDLVIGSAQQAPWIAYREGTKTCIAKIALGLLIVRKDVIDALRHNGEDEGTWGDWLYTNVGSDDKANAESILFNVVAELQANELLIAGFGHLYYQATEENPDAGPPIRTIGIRFRST
jgi:hypothetical protein